MRGASTPDMPDAAAELARLRATNADLRVQLAAFRTLDVQYAARTTALASERDALLTHAAVADALRASVEDMRAGLMEARSEAHFYRRHAQELVQELGVRSVSRFSDDSSRSASSASLDEVGRRVRYRHMRSLTRVQLTDSDESIATEGDATLVEHPVVWEAEHDSTYDALMKMCAAKPERPLKSFLPISEVRTSFAAASFMF
jgi:hypothetical protein